MKKAILAIGLVALCGCAEMSSSTTRTLTTNPTNGVVTVVEKTDAHAVAVLEANSALTKFSNRSGYATNASGTFAPGTYASGLNESATGTNFVEALKQANQMIQTISSKVP